MNIAQNRAAEVVSWMLREGRFNTRMREFGDEMCRRIVDAGIPIVRGFCYVGTLHPQIAASAYIWKRDEIGAIRVAGEHGLETSEDFVQSPLMAARRTRQLLRRKLEDPSSFDFPVLNDLRNEGGTDYVALPMVCSNGDVNAISFMTDTPGGFGDGDIAGLEEIARALSVIVELQSIRRIAKTLLDTYVGPRTGVRVLKGAIRRGTGETIRAVIWMNDLRDFTGAAQTLQRDVLITLLNDYFEILARAVLAERGEILKFIGDGMLAVFELQPGEDPSPRCEAALRAARKAVDDVAERNRMREAQHLPPIRFGIALHLGEVYYGNIGAPERLDFTVIGPAVNHASRIEKRGSELGSTVVTSASFAAAARESLKTLGFHHLRGIAEPQEIFAPKT